MARSIWRRDFDERHEFVAVRPLRFASGTVRVGELVDKAATTPRRLRQLYDSRWIDIAPAQAAAHPSAPAPEAPATIPSPSSGPEDALAADAAMLDGSEVVPVPGWGGEDALVVDAAEHEPVASEEYVPLPENWRGMAAMDIRRLAEALTGERHTTKASAVAVLEDYERGRPA